MLSTTAKEHRDYFRKNGAIQFDELISDELLADINKEIDILIAKRRAKARSHPEKKELTTHDYYLFGHDLWRESNLIKKTVCSKPFARIASELFDCKPIRIGCDQLYTGHSNYPWRRPKLEETCSLQGVIGGALIALDEGGAIENAEGIFPSTPGSIVFFKEDKRLPLEELKEQLQRRFLLIVYTQEIALYIRDEKDPHTHTLKQYGYIFGERLQENLNPLVYK